jgi:hypothetical protein
MHYIH